MKSFLYVILLCVFSIPNFLDAQTAPNRIEKEIYSIYQKSLLSQKDEFPSIINKLDSIHKKEEKSIHVYWIAYAKYLQAFFSMATDEDESALKALLSGIQSLKEVKSPSSEHLTLQGSMISLSISLRPGLAAVLSADADKLYKKALKLDENNLRTYLALGRSDYHKPAQYGGGKNVESYLKMALTKPDTTSNDELTPTWGREDIYYYLVKYYMRESRYEEAQLFCKRGLKLFPDNKPLKELAKELE